MYKEPETNYEKVKEFYHHNRKTLRKLFFVVVFFLSLFTAIHISKTLIERFNYVSRLNSMINQMALILDNVRALYAIDPKRPNIMNVLVHSGTIPPDYIKNGMLINRYGGRIIVENSVPMIDSEGNEYPTFNMSYQGLSRDICIEMATIHWEGIGSGLIAEAIGVVEIYGIDTAIQDLDRDAVTTNESADTEDIYGVDTAIRDLDRDAITTNKKTSKQYVKHDYISTVAKPHDNFIPTPFEKDQAERGCACKKNNCSFAMRYYSINKK